MLFNFALVVVSYQDDCLRYLVCENLSLVCVYFAEYNRFSVPSNNIMRISLLN